jgi:hypothetical protein
MDTSYWNRPLADPVGDFNWIEVSGGIWQVRPTSNDPTDPSPSPNRNKNSLGTKCNYSDFKLAFQFRCPDMRALFRTCGNRLLSPQNWGNSGVKILDKAGYEVQIMDSAGFTLPAGTDAATVITGVAVPGFNFCAANQLGVLKLGDICGAIYHTLGPTSNPVKAAANDPGYVPKGDWNTMVIEFMAARYKRNADNTDWVEAKCSTISVTLNGQLIQAKIGLKPTKASNAPLFDEKARLICDSIYDEAGQPPLKYCKASGIILFQEHDTYVQFKGIEIDPKWLPSNGGAFDKTWQQETGCKPRVD